MNGQHLNDQKLQDYLDRNLPDSDPAVRHLLDCPHCQKSLAAYQALYLALETEPEMSLSPDFSQKVLDKIAIESNPAIRVMAPAVDDQSRNRWRVRDSVWIFAMGAILLIATAYFVGFDSFLRPFIDWVSSARTVDAGWISTTKSHAKELNLNYTLILFAALTIAAVGLVDRLISRRHHRKPMTFMI